MKSQEGRTIGAVDIGGTKIAVGLVDEAGKVLASDECPTDQASGFQSGVDFERTEIRRSSLGPQAAIVGAARTWHQRFVEKGVSSVVQS